MTNSIETAVGQVTVWTSEPHRGYTPEEIATRAVAKIIHIGDQSHPVIRAQAQAFRESIYHVLVHYLKEAQDSERTTICGKLTQQGLDEIAQLIRTL